MEVNTIINASIAPEQWFSWVGQLVSYGWIILVFLPRRVKWLFFIPQYLIPFGVGLLYAVMVLNYFFTVDGGFGSLADVRTFFANDHMLLAGWIHYLAFDLFIGAWIARKADIIGVSRLIQAPVLVATNFFGPLGLVLFLSMQAVYYKSEDKIDV